MDVSLIFFVAGIIIIAGFFGDILFEKTRVPDALLLLGIGLLLGPISGYVTPGGLTQFAGYFGTLALIIILFEGGMEMDLDKLVSEFGAASLLVTISFALTVLTLAAYLHLARGWDLLPGLLLGTVLGCTSAPVIIPVISKLAIRKETRTVLAIESSLSDVLAIVCAVSLIEIVTLGRSGSETPYLSVAGSYAIAIAFGVIVGVAWLKVLDTFSAKKYSYMFTQAAVLVVFGTAHILGGSGPMAVLVFGLVLGNSHRLGKVMNLSSHTFVETTIKFFHNEMTFFIRTFFFVYVGLMVSLAKFDRDFVQFTLALLLIIVAVRFISVSLMVKVYREKKGDRFIMTTMLPRCLASAVLATVAASAHVRGGESFIGVTFAIIVFTTIIMRWGVFVFDRKVKRENGALMG
jgi:cell volume regulation protein A